MMGPQYTALIVTPGLDQYNASLKKVILVYQIVDLKIKISWAANSYLSNDSSGNRKGKDNMYYH